MKTLILPLLGLAALSLSSHAAFIVEAHSSGLANGNFSYGGDTTTASASVASAGVGLAGSNSIFGGNGNTLPDTYVFSYTPGSDADNFSPSAGSLLGSTTGFGSESASGIAGGGSGLYNVYWTTPASTNSSGGGINFTLAQNGAPISVLGVDGNNGGTGADLDPGPAFVGGANNSWFLLGTVDLSAGSTYTVTQETVNNTFVSMRSHAVMWEAIPEPSSAALSLLGALALVVRRRR